MKRSILSAMTVVVLGPVLACNGKIGNGNGGSGTRTGTGTAGSTGSGTGVGTGTGGSTGCARGSREKSPSALATFTLAGCLAKRSRTVIRPSASTSPAT